MSNIAWTRVARLVFAGALIQTVTLPAPASALPGPPLTQPAKDLRAAVHCQANPSVLLVHGAIGDGEEWTGNYAKVLPERGYGVCVVTVPGRILEDLQTGVEYVVHAIRATRRRARRPIVVIGHSGGALLSTFALRFWPDLGQDVSDFIGLAGVYGGGSDRMTALCAIACPAAARQIEPGSAFLTAYTTRPLYRGPGYTTINTQLDELVTPQPSAGQLTGARNITLQDVCPGRVAEHVGIIFDAVTFDLVLDAIGHPGPADPRRLSPDACGQTTIAGVDAAPFVPEVVNALVPAGSEFADNEPEPRLRCPFAPDCLRPRLTPRLRVAARVRGHGTAVTGTLALPAGAIDACSGVIHVRHRARRVGVDCRFALRVARRGRLTVRFSGSRELLPVARRIRVVRHARFSSQP